MVNDNNVKSRNLVITRRLGFVPGAARVLLLVLGVVFSINAFAVDVDVSVDRSQLTINESFKLTFSASESPDDDPDFTPLEENFQILNQRKSSQSSWVNGQSTKRISWVLDMMAKRAGSLQIPVISFGDDSSRALQINVMASAVKDNISVDDEIYLQVSAVPSEVYVQAQILYTIRLFQRVQISQASLSEPEPDNAIIEKIGKDKQYNTKIDGVNYLVFERKYAIFPQESGQLVIPAVELTAQVVTAGQSSRYGSIFNAQRSRTKRVRSKAITVDVLPALDRFNGQHWLAAENVHLQQTWSNSDLTVIVGEPLTRTLSLVAKGVTASQLPDLVSVSESTNVTMYPDQPVLKNQPGAAGVTALREQKVAIIPATAGEYQLPAIEIPWFNTSTGLMEIALIPEVTITAIAKEGVKPNAPVATESPEKLADQVESQDKAVPPNTEYNYWKWLSIIVTIGWLFTLVWMLRKRCIKSPSVQSATDEQLPLKKVIKKLQAACKANNPKQVKQALMQWGELQYNTHDLEVIATYCGAALQTEIKKLNECLYARIDGDWKGHALVELVVEQSQLLQKETTLSDELEPLHRL